MERGWERGRMEGGPEDRGREKGGRGRLLIPVVIVYVVISDLY